MSKSSEQKLFIVTCLLTIFPALVSSPASADWDKTYGGEGWERAKSVQVTADGGYVMAGSATVNGVSRAWLLKTDADGNLMWDKMFAQEASTMDTGEFAQETADGGYIILASSFWEMDGGLLQSDVWLIKTDSNGTVMWDKTFGGPYDDPARNVQQTSDGGYVFTGTLRSDADFRPWLVKTDSDGNTMWEKTLGQENEGGVFFQQTTDGGYIVASSGSEALLIKTDADGNELWNKSFGSGKGPNFVRQTSDGGYIVTGGQLHASPGRTSDLWLMKTDAGGNKLWERIFEEEVDGVGVCAQETPDGRYVILGESFLLFSSSDPDPNIRLIGTDTDGNEMWERRFGGADEDDMGFFMIQADEGSFLISGSTTTYGAGNEDAWLIKTSPTLLTQINLASPANDVVVSSPPTFSWIAKEDEIGNLFAVDLSYTPDFSSYFSTWNNMRLSLQETTWTMATKVWRKIPHGKRVYWRVRGIDLWQSDLRIVVSDEARSFYKR